MTAPTPNPAPGDGGGTACACLKLTAVYEKTDNGLTREVGWRCGNCERLVPRTYERDIDALRARVAELEALLAEAFRAGAAYATGSHADFEQTHPDCEEWVRAALAAGGAS